MIGHGKWWQRFLIIGPYLLVVAVGFLGLRGAEHESHQRCLDRQADRAVLRQVVEISTQTSGTTSMDLTKVPGFDELDQHTQDYLRSLSELLTSAGPTSRQSLRDQLLAKLPPITC